MFRLEPEERIEVRSLVPAKWQETVFQVVAQLAPGDSFMLVSNRNPEPLYVQLEAAHPGRFWWSDVEKGPTAWRSEIGRYPLSPLH